MGNADDLTYAMEVARESVGSVDAEMDVVMQTFEKRVEVMKGAWTSLANATMDSDIAKGLVDLTTGFLRLIEACGGLTTALIAVGVAMATFKLSRLASDTGVAIKGIGSLITALKAYKIQTNQATVATTAFNVAKMGLIAGGIAIGVMAIGAGLNYVSKEAERAEQRLKDVTEAVNAQANKAVSVTELAKEYETLSNKVSLTADEQERYTQVQNELKATYPELLGYYDSSNNFIITQGEALDDVIAKQEEILRLKREELAMEANENLERIIGDYEHYTEAIELGKQQAEDYAEALADMYRWQELNAKPNRTEEEEWEMDTLNMGLTILPIELSNLETYIDLAQEELDKMELGVHMRVVNDASFIKLREKDKQAISEALGNLTNEQLVQTAQGFKDNTFTVAEYIAKLRELGLVAGTITPELDKAGRVDFDDTLLTSLGVVSEEVANSLDILQVATDELNTTNDISEDTMKKLLQKYPLLAGQITDTTTAQQALQQQMANNEFTKATDDIATLISLQEDLADGTGLSASSFKKLSETFPELLAYMNDEVAMTEAMKGKKKELEETQATAYRNMLMTSEDYYNANLKGNAEMTNGLNSQLAELFNSYGFMYQDDAKNWSSLAQGKAKTEQTLINNLNKAWSDHFSAMGRSFGTIAEAAQFNYTHMGIQTGDMEELERMHGYSKAMEEQRKALQGLAEVFNGIKFDPINIDTTGIGVGLDKSSGGGSGGGSGSKAPDPSYISSIYKEIVAEILKGGEDIEQALSNTQVRLDNAILMGDSDLEKQLSSKMANLRFALREEQSKIVAELEVQMGKMAKTLSDTGLLKGYDMAKLSAKDLAEVNQKLETQIDKAKVSSNDKEVKRLEMLKSIISDIGGTYVDTIKQRDEASEAYWQRENERLEGFADDLDKFYAKKFDAIAREEKLMQMQLDMLLEDGGDWDKEDKDSTKRYALEEKLIQNSYNKRKLIESQIAQLKAKGFTEESTEIKELIDRWIDYEDERLQGIKNIATARRQDAIDSASNQISDLEYAKDNMEALLNLSVDMLKKELELKKEALEKSNDDRKEALEDAYNLEKDALNDKLALLKKEADARKKALSRESEERDFNDDVSEQQKKIAEIQNKLTELSLDDSISAQTKRKELAQELAKEQKALEDMLYDRSKELQEDAIDDELAKQEDKIKSELDNLEEQYEKEKELLEDSYKKELEALEKKLKEEGTLREEANKLILEGDRYFYSQLKDYATTYTDRTKAEFDSLWDLANEGLEKYGNGQYNVIASLETMTEKIILLKEELKELNDETSYQDFLPDSDKSDKNPANDYEMGAGKPEPKPEPEPSEPELSEAGKKQLAQQRYLHEQMKIAIATNNEGLKKWVMAERKKWDLEPTSGAIVKQRHEGITMGRLGDDLKPSELMLKATKDEWVFTGRQMDNLESNLKGAVNGGVSGGINVVCDFTGATISKDTLPDLEALIKKQLPKVLNDTLKKKAIR